MKTSKKVWIIIAVCLIALGSIIGTLALASVNFDFLSLSTEAITESEQLIDKDFSSIKIDVRTSDVIFVPSEDEKCRVICTDTENVKHTATVKDDSLLITVEDRRKWYDHIGIFFGNTSVTVALPKENYDLLNITGNTSDITISKDFIFTNIKITTDTGDVSLLSSAKETLDISTDTGDIEIGSVLDIKNIKRIECKNIKIESDTGEIELWRTMASDTITVKNNTGDVWFCIVESPYVNVVTNTGDVEGDLYYAPTFKTKTDTGTLKVPPAKSDDFFEITTDTGDIYFKVVK